MRLALLLALVSLPACASEPAPPANGPAPRADAPAAQTSASKIDSSELKRRMDAGKLTVVDVRTDGEWQSGHVPGALHIPIDQLAARAGELESYKDQDLYLICAVGGRSAAAQRMLRQKGFNRTIDVTDGTNGWRAAGYPVE